MANTCHQKYCCTFFKPAQQTNAGKRGHQLLNGHYLGPTNVDTMDNATERKLKSTTYTDEKKRWNSKRYVQVHSEKHPILEGLVEHGCAGIDNRSKVQHLMTGIKTNTLDSVKTHIMASPVLRNDFTDTVRLYIDFIKQHQIEHPTLNISAVAYSGS
jgi:hypothetical protein